MAPTNTAGNPFLERVYGIKTVDDCKAIYDEWAATFDKDLLGPSQDYVAHFLVAQAVLQSNGNINGAILDAGCGTGLSGIALNQVGAKTIDGVDLSTGMLKVAEKSGVYRTLGTADLTKPIAMADATYDVVTCVGTLTLGHVGPVPALEEFLRITKPSGLVVATVLDDIWISHGYKAEVDRLTAQGLAELVSAENMDYRKGADVKARVLVLRKK